MYKFVAALVLCSSVTASGCSFAFGKPHSTVNGARCVERPLPTLDLVGASSAGGALLVTGVVLPSLAGSEKDGAGIAAAGILTAVFIASAIYGSSHRCPP